MFSKILIANRGEIALRVVRACKEMGIPCVVVHSEADTNSKPVRLADESICIGPAASKNSYLNMSSILSAADICGADAIHPGVGFLSENAVFAQMVQDHHMTFIGPSPKHIAQMGDKITAKETMLALGVPCVPGSEGEIKTVEDAQKIAASIGYPVILKATSGGGGKGMRPVYAPEEMKQAFQLTRAEAQANFGNDQLYMERYLANPRHIEVQVVADKFGNVAVLGERDCSIQRRHQKLWEEAPSPALTSKHRQHLRSFVTEAMKKMGYLGVGTLEFLFEEGAFFFMEMNTRIQVEHPITEMITGIDLIQEQINVAAGKKLSFNPEEVTFTGHAIECRINAENSETFQPSPGHVKTYHAPGGFGVRVDSHIYTDYHMPPYYDSLLGKLIIHGKTRDACIKRLKRALSEYIIEGIDTTIPLHRILADQPDIKKGHYSIHWLEAFLKK